MDKILMHPIDHSINAKVRIPGSKSLTNRALMIASLADGQTCLDNALFSDDSRYFANALIMLGFNIRSESTSQKMWVLGNNGKIPVPRAELFIGNAGTAARFLSAFLTLGDGEYILDGDSRMRERPIGDLVEALTQLGANIKPINPERTHKLTEIYPPVKITASGLSGGKTTIAGKISSQYLSALLMVSPYAKNTVEIVLSTELNSKYYVDMTIEIMSEFGINVKRTGYEHFWIDRGGYHPLQTYSIEPDASASSYFFAAASILGGSVRVANLTRKSKQGDIRFIDTLQMMGCSVMESEYYIQVTGPNRPGDLRGVDVDMRDIPDTAQTLAAIAPFANSPTYIRGIASARVKETDRIKATCKELARLGVKVEEHQDGMSIYPCKSFKSTTIQTYNDHRMAMAFSLIGLKTPGISIENPGCVSKTFPDFFQVLEGLR